MLDLPTAATNTRHANMSVMNRAMVKKFESLLVL